MKKSIICFAKRAMLCLAGCLLAAVVPVQAEEDIVIRLDEAVILEQSQLTETDGSILVPLRALAEAVGAGVRWDFTHEVATVTYLGNTIKLKEGQPTADVNGADVPVTQPVQKYEGLLYAPVRFVAENLGLGVTWDEENQTVHISSKGPADIGHLYEVVAVSASEDDGNKPENVLDRNYQTRWSAESNGAYITLELDDIHPVAYIGVANYNGDQRQETLSVQVSTDGQNFELSLIHI